MGPLQIAALLAFLAAFLAALWIFYDSNRQGHPATAYKTIATAMAVLTLPGVILTISPDLLRGDPTAGQVLTYLSLIAGGVAVVGLIFYAVRLGLSVPERQPCPSCRRPLDPTWDRCPYCGYSFVTATPPLPETPTPAPSPLPEPVVPLTSELQETKVLRPTPGHFTWLVVLNGPRQGQEFRLRDDVFIGRDGTRCEVVLEDLAVSDLHARVKREEDQFILHDLGSTNGTFLNGEQVYRHPLSDKDRLQLGETQLVFIKVREKEVQAAPTVGPAAEE
jgi:hypothetical protein